MIPKLRGLCHAHRSIVHISNINTQKSIYYAYFHSTIKYAVPFGQFFQQWEGFHFT
jgi:hypothetical protein